MKTLSHALSLQLQMKRLAFWRFHRPLYSIILTTVFLVFSTVVCFFHLLLTWFIYKVTLCNDVIYFRFFFSDSLCFRLLVFVSSYLELNQKYLCAFLGFLVSRLTPFTSSLFLFAQILLGQPAISGKLNQTRICTI
ncbi:hypothetical protein HanIR_Chr13g0626001 [Helianthus annuus]|nr:hypothetical protein HanIR_Chr13g0626001 [Helianthus annuus]